MTIFDLHLCLWFPNIDISKKPILKEMFWVIGNYLNAPQLYLTKPLKEFRNYIAEFLTFRKSPLIQGIHLQNCFHFLQILSGKKSASSAELESPPHKKSESIFCLTLMAKNEHLGKMFQRIEYQQHLQKWQEENREVIILNSVENTRISQGNHALCGNFYNVMLLYTFY
jgi:hypothetical protein